MIRIELINYIRKYYIRDLVDLYEGDYDKVRRIIQKREIGKILDIEKTQL